MGWEVVATPGHTPGHVSYRLGTTIAGGDAFMTGEPFREAVAVFVADRAEARRSIEKLAGLDLRWPSAATARPPGRQGTSSRPWREAGDPERTAGRAGSRLGVSAATRRSGRGSLARLAEVRDAVLDRAAPAPGETLLDVGFGGG